MATLSSEAVVALIQAAIKYGPDIALEFAGLFKSGTTIDQAIAALQKAKTKTAQDYLDEAKAAQTVAVVTPA